MSLRWNLATDEDGLTAVVATILLVAVVLGLAAGAFVIIQILASERSDAAPAVGFTKDEDRDRLVVASAVDGAYWNRIQLQATIQSGSATALYVGTGSTVVNDAAAATGGQLLGQRVAASEDATRILGNDFLEFCADGTAAGVAVSVYDAEANVRLGTWTFNDIRPC